MRKQVLVSLGLVTLAINPLAHGKTGRAVVPAEKVVLDRSVREAADPTMRAQGQENAMAMGKINSGATAEARVVELSSKCSGSCELVDSIENAVRNPQAMELGPQAQANANLAAARALELTKTGMDPEMALTKAVEDMQLDPTEIKENCR